VKRLLAGLLLSSFFCSSSSLTAAEEWSRFRGPTGDGHSTAVGLPLEWNASENIAWKVKVPGLGWSSPIVHQGKIFLTTSVPTDEKGITDDQALHTLCLDPTTGETLWDVAVFEQSKDSNIRIHGKNSHASPTPIAENGRIYVHYGAHGTACLTVDGKIVWKNTDLQYQAQHGNGSSPILAGDLLVASCDGRDIAYLVALNKNTGKIVWKKSRPKVENNKLFSFSTPTVISVAGKTQIISVATDLVIAYEPTSGKEIWRVTFDGFSVVPCPIFKHGLVYVCTGWSPPKLLAIKPDGTGDATETHMAWSSRQAVPNTPSVIMVGEELYFISDRGVASCVDAKTGKLHWTERVGGKYSASPIVAEGKIYFQSEEGKTTVIQAGTTYKMLAESNLNLEERTFASFAVLGQSLLLRSEFHLFKIGK